MTQRKTESGAFKDEHGGNIPGTSKPAYSLFSSTNTPLPIVIAVPHAGRQYPPYIIETMRDFSYANLKLEDRFVDVLGSAIARNTGSSLIIANAPRAMIDLNRAKDDIDWDMVIGAKSGELLKSQANKRARSGLGLIPRRLPGFGEIWRTKLTEGEVSSRIRSVYDPYHSVVCNEITKTKEIWGSALLIDLHSMPPLKQQPDGNKPPKFVIGDRFGSSCSALLSACAYEYLQMNGQPVSHNRPYAGGYVLDTHAAPQRGIHAMQIEICRSTYLDQRQDEISPRAGSIIKLMSDLVSELGRRLLDLGPHRDLSEAAE